MNVMFSFCIPVHNGLKYLPECLNSIYQQDFTDWEVIIVDDASSDGVDEFVLHQKFFLKNKISYIRLSANNGPHLARKIAFENSSGKYIFFMDSDDKLLSKNVLSQLNEIFLKYNCDLIMFNMISDLSNNKACIPYKKYLRVNSIIKPEEILPLYAKSSDFNNIWNKVFIKKIFPCDYVNYPNFKMCEDRLLSFQLIENSKSIFVYDKSLYFYRQVPSSTTHSQIYVDVADQISFVEDFLVKKYLQHKINPSLLKKNFLKTWARLCFTSNLDKHFLLALSENTFFRQCFKDCLALRPDFLINNFLLFYKKIDLLIKFIYFRNYVLKLFNFRRK